MKKITVIASLALGLMFSSNVKAIIPTQLKAENNTLMSDISIESEIEVQSWMFSFDRNAVLYEVEVEKEIRLEAWMINESWSFNPNLERSEDDIELADWMTASFDKAHRVMALGL